MSPSISPEPPVIGELYLYDTVIKAQNVFQHPTEDFNLYLTHCETNQLESEFGTVTVDGCTFESVSLEILPEPFIVTDFLIGDFIYSRYNIQNEGSGSSFWADELIQYGIIGTTRYGIGYFYFYIPIPNFTPPAPIIPSEIVDNTFPPNWILNSNKKVTQSWASVRYGV